jgi:hypothetical protein
VLCGLTVGTDLEDALFREAQFAAADDGRRRHSSVILAQVGAARSGLVIGISGISDG